MAVNVNRFGRWLNAVNVEVAQALLTSLTRDSLTPEEARQALEDAHLTATRAGALWAALSLLGQTLPPVPAVAKPRHPLDPHSATFQLEQAAREVGLRFTLRNQDVQRELANQSSVAARILFEHLNAGGLSDTNPQVRAASWAANWASRKGIHEQATRASVTKDGTTAEIRKTWIRTFPREEHRKHHDALEGVTIPYSGRFTLNSPRHGTLDVIGPYDGTMPRDECYRCGHSTIIRAPDGANVTPWEGA
ncbi:MAG TPA: hypothetical protein VHN99_06865 [Deinococcales bacterium]|nr:hypothetical protein [Deinococcales bacterium]